MLSIFSIYFILRNLYDKEEVEMLIKAVSETDAFLKNSYQVNMVNVTIVFLSFGMNISSFIKIILAAYCCFRLNAVSMIIGFSSKKIQK